jgi:hypothetical protein
LPLSSFFTLEETMVEKKASSVLRGFFAGWSVLPLDLRLLLAEVDDDEDLEATVRAIAADAGFKKRGERAKVHPNDARCSPTRRIR